MDNHHVSRRSTYAALQLCIQAESSSVSVIQLINYQCHRAGVLKYVNQNHRYNHGTSLRKQLIKSMLQVILISDLQLFSH